MRIGSGVTFTPRIFQVGVEVGIEKWGVYADIHLFFWTVGLDFLRR